MGGTAFLIWGKLSEPRLKPIPVERTFLDRIMGRQRFEKPNVTNLGDGRRIIDFPATKYQVLADDFREFLTNRISDPWPATQAFLNYLKDDVLSIYVRGEQNPELSAPDYYIQITFSGCAGMAEISAELGSHWAAIYYRETHERIKDRHLNHFGFVPDDARMGTVHKPQFLPLGRLGYAMYSGGDPAETDTEWEGSRLFEMDASVTDTFFEQGDLSTLSDLDNRFGPLMKDGKCRCQLCMPGLDPSSLGELPF
jgi:hypothetical protein